MLFGHLGTFVLVSRRICAMLAPKCRSASGTARSGSARISSADGKRICFSSFRADVDTVVATGTCSAETGACPSCTRGISCCSRARGCRHCANSATRRSSSAICVGAAAQQHQRTPQAAAVAPAPTPLAAPAAVCALARIPLLMLRVAYATPSPNPLPSGAPLPVGSSPGLRFLHARPHARDLRVTFIPIHSQ